MATSALILTVVLWPKPKEVVNESLAELFDEGVAVVTQSHHTEWAGETRLQVGSSVSPGKVALQSGLI